MSEVKSTSRQFVDPEWLSGYDLARMGQIVGAAADLALIVSHDGAVLEYTMAPDLPTAKALGLAIGIQLHASLTEESRPKLDALLAQARNDAPPFGREINHRDHGQGEHPFRYSAVPGAKPGQILILGRDLRPIAQLQNRLVSAQMALEEDYERFRQVEGRYRVLLETVPYALVLLAADHQTVIDANMAALRLLRRDLPGISGDGFAAHFSFEDQRTLTDALSSVRATGQTATVTVELRHGMKVAVEAALFRAAASTLLLCRLLPDTSDAGTADFAQEALPSLFRNGGDAIVLTDQRGRIQRGNDAFLSLTGIALEENLRGQSLDAYLGRGSVDLNVMLSKASEHGRMKMYATTLLGRFGASVPVEISVTHLADTVPPGFGFVIRDASRAVSARGTAQAVSRDSVAHVMELVGSAPLKDLVRSTTDVVERMCIEAALELTGNNRASAAEMLGLSRQSLYVKLRKFGMVRPGDDEE